MKYIHQVLLCSIVLLALGSCSYVYYPTCPVVPDAKDEGFGVQGTIGLTRAQISGWYALDSNIYFSGSVSGALSLLENSDSGNNRKYNAISGTVGAGYKLKLTDHFELQLQAGLGACKGYFHSNVFNTGTNNNDLFDAVDIETRSIRGYVQPVFGFTHPKGGGFFLIPRVTYESFVSIRQTPSPFFNTSVNLRPRSFLLTELYGLGRINAKVVNIDIYLGLSTNLFNQNTNSSGSISNNENNSLVAQPFLFGVGVSKTFY